MSKIAEGFKSLPMLLSKKVENENRRIYAVLLLFSLIALYAALVLSIDEFYLLKNPDAVLNCSVNLVLNCASVMKTWQAEIFGFPNMFIGLIAYSVIATVAFIGLTGVKYSKNFLIAVNLGIFGGILFSEWLIAQSIYSIGILCPYCLVVAFSTIMIFAAITHMNLRNNAFSVSKDLNKKIQKFLDKEYDKVVVALWVVLIAALIVSHFGPSLFA